MVRFCGCANPVGREVGYNGFELDNADVRIACKEIVGKPILIEHQGAPVGVVESAWVAQDGRMMVVGATDETNPRGLFAKNLLVDQAFTELSLGSTARVDTDTLDVRDKHFHELSLVEKGLREGTEIESLDQTKRTSYKDALVQVQCSAAGSAVKPLRVSGFELMSAAAAPPAPTSDSQAAPATGSQSAPIPAQNEPSNTNSNGNHNGQPPAVPATGPPTGAPQEQAQAPSQAVPQGTNEELLRRVAELENKNRQLLDDKSWMENKVKRSYGAAFDAATESFLRNLQVEDTEGREQLIKNLQQMAQTPSASGSQGNAVMEVVCAASRANMTLMEKVENQLQTQKRAKTAEQPAEAGGVTNFANDTARHTNNTNTQPAASAAYAPPVVQQTIPVPQPRVTFAPPDKKLFDWLSDTPVRQGMEHVNYPNVVGKDFSSTKRPTQY